MPQAVEIFISYANPDRENATRLAQQLANDGFRPYLEPKDDGSVPEQTANTRRAVRAADFFLLCLSAQTTNAKRLLDGQQQKTLDLFFNDTASTAFLIPVRLEPCTLPKSLRAFEYEAEKYKLPVDLFEQGGWQNLLQTMNFVLERRAQVDQEFLELSEAELPDEQPAVDDLNVENLPGADFNEGPDDPSSVDQWEIELRRVLDGEREYAIEQLGMIDYVEVKIEEASDRPAAKTAFHKALRRIVKTWQPLTEHERYDFYVLDLITTYTLPEGFVKVADMVSSLDLEPSTFHYEVPSDNSLVMKALYALEAISPFPPLAEDPKVPAYRRYVDLLQNRILDERYSFYAIRRLLELGEIHPESTNVQPLIGITYALQALVSALLEPTWRSPNEPGLTNLYHLCLDNDEHVSNFAKSVTEEGWVMEYGDNQLVLSQVDPPQKITIQILDDDKQKFYVYSEMSVLEKKDEILEEKTTAAAAR